MLPLKKSTQPAKPLSSVRSEIPRSQALPGNALHGRLRLVCQALAGGACKTVGSQAEPGNQKSGRDLRGLALAPKRLTSEPLPNQATKQQTTEQLAVLQRLAQEIEQLETSGRSAAAQAKISSAGCAALDALLPAGGYAAGSVVEYLRTTPACGASTLAWGGAAAAMHSSGGFLVVVDTQHNVFPPALTSHGIDLGKVIFVRPQSQADALWAVDQALRTSAVAAVVAELERIDDRSARRLQLAAECGGGLALLLRSAAARKQPSWAEVQWLVRSESASQRRWWMQLARVRGGRAGQSVCLEIDPLTGQLTLAPLNTPLHRNSHGDSPHHLPGPSQGAVHLAAQLAHATPQQATERATERAPHDRPSPPRRAAAS